MRTISRVIAASCSPVRVWVAMTLKAERVEVHDTRRATAVLAARYA